MIVFLKDYIDAIMFVVLGLMGFLALWMSIERVIFFSTIKLANYHDEDALDDALTNNLTTIYIVYQNAPYVGLLGTIIGIMITFYDLSISTNISTKDVMLGLSLALKATALGLLVAIPTLILYNALLRKASLLSSQWRELKREAKLAKPSGQDAS